MITEPPADGKPLRRRSPALPADQDPRPGRDVAVVASQVNSRGVSPGRHRRGGEGRVMGRALSFTRAAPGRAGYPRREDLNPFRAENEPELRIGHTVASRLPAR